MKILTAAATPAISLSFDFPSTGEQPYGPTIEAGFQKLLDSTSALKNLVDGVKAPGGVTDAMIGSRVVNPALVPTSSNPATHTDRLSQLANRVAAILGTDWFGNPAATIASLNALTTLEAPKWVGQDVAYTTGGKFTGTGGVASDPQDLHFYKHDGRTYFAGKAISNNIAGSVLFTLPAGYRPSAARMFWPGPGNVRVEVQTTGNVVIVDVPGGGVSTNFDDIHFRIA